jgi:lipid-binding SYLF domain-containing protein
MKTFMREANPKLVLLALVCALALSTAAATDKEKQQQKVRNMAQDTLQRLYKAEPRAKASIKRATGYAVFSDVGVKILFAGSDNGKGIAGNNPSKPETFMKMLELQAGLGMGVEKFRVVFVFDNEKAFGNFVNSAANLVTKLYHAGKPETKAAP